MPSSPSPRFRETDCDFSGANVRCRIDANGNRRICKSDVDGAENLAGQACTPADEWIYDRGFGG